jgi:hypothetical protein
MNPIVLKKQRIYYRNLKHWINTINLHLHVREVLIESLKRTSSMLLEYQWKYNTLMLAEIKLRADVICETYVSKNGLFKLQETENNTSEVIDNQIG